MPTFNIDIVTQPGSTDFTNYEQVKKLRGTLDSIVLFRSLDEDQYYAVNEAAMLVTEIMLSLKREANAKAEPVEMHEFFVNDDDYHDQEAPIRILAPSAADAALQFAKDADVNYPLRVARVVKADGQVMLFNCTRHITHSAAEICQNHCASCDGDGYCNECGNQ